MKQRIEKISLWMPAILAVVMAWLITAGLSGCAATPPEPEELPPPRLVKHGPDGPQRKWENIGSFRPVPVQMRAKAIEVCEDFGARPAGFHPRAVDENGKTFAEGGFYCVKD